MFNFFFHTSSLEFQEKRSLNCELLFIKILVTIVRNCIYLFIYLLLLFFFPPSTTQDMYLREQLNTPNFVLLYFLLTLFHPYFQNSKAKD